MQDEKRKLDSDPQLWKDFAMSAGAYGDISCGADGQRRPDAAGRRLGGGHRMSRLAAAGDPLQCGGEADPVPL